MKSNTHYLILIGICLLIALAWSAALVVWSVQCADRGGAFIVPQNSFPVCVAGR